jgi:hypothetical protein
MRNFVLSLATAGFLVAGGVLSASPAHAALLGAPGALDAAVDELAVIHQAQNVYGGRRYCYYENGWSGPGWYWCGYGSRVGLGYGGPVGWRGWTRGGGAVAWCGAEPLFGAEPWFAAAQFIAAAPPIAAGVRYIAAAAQRFAVVPQECGAARSAAVADSRRDAGMSGIPSAKDRQS